MYFALLKTWCDRLLDLQITAHEDTHFHGGILCPSCGRIHGRCADAVYPLLCMADKTDDAKYVEAAKRLFLWAERNMTRPDGSYINDTNSEWRCITVFAAIALADALTHHGHLLDTDTRALWEARLQTAMGFLQSHQQLMWEANINYPITCCAAFAVAGRYFGREDYHGIARDFARSVMGYFTEEGLIYGEGKPMHMVTPKGCRPIDLGYNVEEALPALVLYALIEEDEAMLDIVIRSMRVHLDFMLPDGGWDNSWGSRSNKWTYWGSRTSDGMQTAYGLLMDRDPAFAEALYRNTRLMADCTRDGLLDGGPMYGTAGEPPCVHHTFCHVKSLATLINHGITPGSSAPLPRQTQADTRHYPSIATWLLAKGPWRATVTGYDFDYIKEGHATGGALTMLWHDALGPLVAASMTAYQLVEPNNMQIPQYYMDICQTPRIEYRAADGLYRSINDASASITVTEAPDCVQVDAKGVLRNADLQGCIPYALRYSLYADRLAVSAVTDIDSARLLFPLISASGTQCTQESPTAYTVAYAQGHVRFACSHAATLPEVPARQFNPVGGFETLPFCIQMKAGQPVALTLTPAMA